MNGWISVEARLPENRTYVLVYHTKDNWHDGHHQEGLQYRVAKFVRGLSLADREKMKRGEMEDPIDRFNSRRSSTYTPADEQGNKERPYMWDEFGPQSYFGQEISHWMPLPDKP